DAHRILTELGSLEHEVESETGQWYLMRIRPYRTVHDKIDGVVVTFVDVTARRKAETDLRESETRLQLAGEAASLGGLGYNPIADQMRWDDRTRQLWGQHAEVTADLQGLWKAIHTDDVAKVRRAVGEALDPAGGETIDCEFRIRAKSGSPERWIRMNGKTF